jgi:ferredoxin-NADP reductase
MNLRLLERIKEADHTESFLWDATPKINFFPGQFIYITIPRSLSENPKDLTQAFTISSSPTEKTLRTTTRIRTESIYKQSISRLKVGETVEADGPFGDLFQGYDSFSNLVLIAGGIGITPFRSFIKFAIDKKLKSKIYLIYSNSDEEFIFKNEFDKWEAENSFLNTYYHNSSSSGHLNFTKIGILFSNWMLDPKDRLSSYWIVGPPNFVRSIEKSLQELKIDDERIHFERFVGY